MQRLPQVSSSSHCHPKVWLQGNFLQSVGFRHAIGWELLWTCSIHVHNFTKSSNIYADCAAAEACAFTSVQHVELPLVSYSCWHCRIHVGFLAWNDGMLQLIAFYLLFIGGSCCVLSLDYPNDWDKKKRLCCSIMVYSTRLLAHIS